MSEIKQVNMMSFGIPTLSDDILNLIKKVQKITGESQADLSLKTKNELEKILENNNKIKEEERKKFAAIKKLQENFEKENLEYDELKTLEENQAVYDQHMDRKNNPSFRYPFRMYFKGCDIRELDDVFTIDTQYTEKTIKSLMFRAGYKEFAGSIKLIYDEVENMLVPDFTSQRHG